MSATVGRFPVGAVALERSDEISIETRAEDGTVRHWRISIDRRDGRATMEEYAEAEWEAERP